VSYSNDEIDRVTSIAANSATLADYLYAVLAIV
jgi:hypothetical protein